MRLCEPLGHTNFLGRMVSLLHSCDSPLHNTSHNHFPVHSGSTLPAKAHFPLSPLGANHPLDSACSTDQHLHTSGYNVVSTYPLYSLPSGDEDTDPPSLHGGGAHHKPLTLPLCCVLVCLWLREALTHSLSPSGSTFRMGLHNNTDSFIASRWTTDLHITTPPWPYGCCSASGFIQSEDQGGVQMTIIKNVGIDDQTQMNRHPGQHHYHRSRLHTQTILGTKYLN